jgi:AAA+ ATPase superfamily predicted ATPase
MGFMENEVLGYKSPLFGRRTAQIKLEGFDYCDAGKMLPGFSDEDKIKLYACIGGTPHYLAQIKAGESFEANIERLYFDISGYLYNEPMMLLQQELREPAMYNSIVSAIAGGASRLNEIATKIDEDSPKVSK